MKRLSILLGFGVVATRVVTSCADGTPPASAPKPDAGAEPEASVPEASLEAGARGCTPDTWCAVALPASPVSLNGVWGSGPNDVWIVGSPDLVLHWDGARLVSAKADTPQTLFGVWGSSGDDVWMFSSGAAIWHTGGFRDGSANLAPVGPSEAGAGYAPGPIAAVWGSSANDVWAVGPLVLDPPTPPVWHCDGWRGGAPNWSAVLTSSADPPQPEPISFNAVWGSADTGVWITGMGGKTRNGVTTNGATKWTAVNSNTSLDLYALWGPGDGTVLAAGAGGTLRRFSRAPGSAWTAATIQLPTEATIHSIYGFGANDIWAAGSGGAILHFDGAAWSVTPAPSAKQADDLFAVWGSNPDDVWIVGRNTLLHRGSKGLPGTLP
jgi:hypothetical protein